MGARVEKVPGEVGCEIAVRGNTAAAPKDQKMEPVIWDACYDEGWRGLIVPAAFAHPAKFAPGLIKRILSHGIDEGWWKPGPCPDVIADPFGGVGCGGVIAAYAGLGWIGLEIEEKFVDLAEQNFALHSAKWLAMNHVPPCMNKGDARRFATIFENLDGFVMSPPYADSINNDRTGIDYSKSTPDYPGRKLHKKRVADHERKLANQKYGSTAGQIGALRSGDIDAVITSPPYAEGGQGGGGDFHPDPDRHGDNSNGGSLRAGYGKTGGQIGNLATGAIDGIVTSPPYSEGLSHGGGRPIHQPGDPTRTTLDGQKDGYGATAGQIGNESGETYWQAMNAVYRQCFTAVKPGGVCVVVVKDYVKDKARVRLCDDTLRLLEHIGFEPVERIHAMLTKTTRTPALFGQEHVHTKERKSFFRRLAEKKGSPRIDYEECLVVRKPMEPKTYSSHGRKSHLPNSESGA